MAETPLDPSQEPPPSMGGLADQWRGFLAEPSNRAFLMQAGLQMLQPRAIGQSELGNAASAIGAGGEAAARVQGAEEFRQERQSVQDARKAGTEAKLTLADAALQRAGAAQTLAQNRELLGGATGTSILGGRLGTQRAINSWLLKEDVLGDDPFMPYLQQKYPDIQSKADVQTRRMSDPAFRRELEALFGGDVVPGQGRELNVRPGAVAPPEKPTQYPNAFLGRDPQGNPGWYIKNEQGQVFKVK